MTDWSVMESQYVTGRKYIYTTGRGDQRFVTLGAIVNGEDGTIKFDGSGRKLTVPLGKLTALPADSTDNTKNTNGVNAPESETVMPPKSNTTKTTGTRSTRKRTTTGLKRTGGVSSTVTPEPTPAVPPLPPVPPTPATVGQESIPATVAIPPQAPAPAAEFSATTNTTKANGKATEMPKTDAPTIDPLSFFTPVSDVFEICDQHRDGGEDEILRAGEWFKIPGTPIPGGPVTTVCDATVWRAIDDIRRHWNLLRMSVEWLDAWIAEQGDNLPERDDSDEFAEYEEGEGQDEDEDPDEDPGTPPPPPAPSVPAPKPAKAPSAALKTVQTDLGTATVASAPRVATGGGQKGQATPGPSRIPKTIDPKVSAHARQFAVQHGFHGKSGPVTLDGKGKLPGEALQAWIAAHPEYAGYVRTWDPR